MGLALQLGHTDKQINSLEGWKNTAFITYNNVKLKAPTSEKSPVFLLKDMPRNVSYMNYALYDGRPYWVDQIVRVSNRHCEVYTHLDILAMYADEIKSNSAFVAYGDEAHWNQDIDDFRFEPEVEDGNWAAQTQNDFKTNFGLLTDYKWKDCAVVLTYMDTSSRPGIHCLAVRMGEFCQIISSLDGGAIDAALSGQSFTEIMTEVGQDLAGLFCAFGGGSSWRDNFFDAVFVPVDISHYGTEYSGTIHIGGTPMQVTGVPISPLTKYQKNETISWTWPYQNTDHDLKFLRNKRWTTMQVLTPAGFQELDTTILRNQTSMYIEFCIVLSSGEWSMRLIESANTRQSIASWSGNCGISLMSLVGTGENSSSWFGNMAQKVGGAAMSFLGGVTSMGVGSAQQNVNIANSINDSVGGNMYGDVVQGAEQNLSKAQTKSMLTSVGTGILGSIAPASFGGGVGSGGLNGGLAGLSVLPVMTHPGTTHYSRVWFMLITKSFITYDFSLGNWSHYKDFCDLYGYPCNQWLQIGNIEGYCRTAGASLKINGATVEEISQINSFLNSGVYIPAENP